MQKARGSKKSQIKAKVRVRTLYRGLPKGEEAVEVMGDYVAAVELHRNNKDSALKLLSKAKENIEQILDNVDVKKNPKALNQYSELRCMIDDYAARLRG